MSTGNVASDRPTVHPHSNIHDRKWCICRRTTGRRKWKWVPREKRGLMLLVRSKSHMGCHKTRTQGFALRSRKLNGWIMALPLEDLIRVSNEWEPTEGPKQCLFIKSPTHINSTTRRSVELLHTYLFIWFFSVVAVHEKVNYWFSALGMRSKFSCFLSILVLFSLKFSVCRR